ncbi:MAG TPA: sialidase family protein [Acidimicrobiales bacterium]|nr:sialidase family protein [Acidimicrobiales bacterium]
MGPAVLVGLLVGFLLGAAAQRPAYDKPDGLSYPAVRHQGPVTAMDLRDSLPAHNSPALAEDPTDARFVALASRMDAPDFACRLHVSGDSGRQWVEVRPVPKLPKGADKCYAPEVSFDPMGRLNFLFVGLQGGGNSPMGAFLVSSTDRGRTFTKPRRVLGAERYMVRMAIDPTVGETGRLHLVWLEATESPPLGGLAPVPNPIMSSFSDDGGRTFSRPVQVSDPDRPRVVSPALALGKDHAVHVLYYDLRDDVVDYQGLEGPTWEEHWSLVVSTSSDGGGHYGRGVVVDDEVVPPERIMLIFTMPPAAIAAGPSGAVFVSWTDGRNGDWDVMFRRSLDGGRSWKSARRLNDDPLKDGRHQYMPRLAISDNGRLDAAFYDRRRDPKNIRPDIFHTFSLDAGARFAPNVRATTNSSDSRFGPRYPIPSAKDLVEFGSRIALLSRDSSALLAWADTRNALAAPQQEIFSTQLEFGRR